MNPTRRESRDIISDILKLCRMPSGKTAIVYGCNLNFNNLTYYLNWCHLRGYLTRNHTKFITTNLGERFITVMESVIALENQIINNGIIA